MGVSYYMAYGRKGTIYIIYIGKNLSIDYDCKKVWTMFDFIEATDIDLDKTLDKLTVNDIAALVNLYNLTFDITRPQILYCFLKGEGFDIVSEYEVNDWRKEGTRVIELGD